MSWRQLLIDGERMVELAREVKRLPYGLEIGDELTTIAIRIMDNGTEWHKAESRFEKITEITI